METAAKVFVGVDVGKDYLDINAGKSPWREENNHKGVNRIISRLKQLAPELVVMESSGGYENLLLEALWAARISVSHVNPRRTKAFAETEGILAKTDKIDAKMLRMFGEKIKPSPTLPPSPEVKELKVLLDRRTQLIEMRIAEMNRVQQPNVPSTIKKKIRNIIACINRQIATIDKEALRCIHASKTLSDKATVLGNEIGVGPVTIMTLLGDLPELGTISRQKIAALVGVAPINNQSGRGDKKRSTKMGRPKVRAILYMATMSAIRKNQHLKRFYLGMVARGKLKMVALVATMRRFIVYLNTLMRNSFPTLINSHENSSATA